MKHNRDAPSRPTIWLDLSDLVDWQGEPTGIQRVVIEYTRRLASRPELLARGCAFRPSTGTYETVDIQQAIAISAVNAPADPTLQGSSGDRPSKARALIGQLIHRAPRVAKAARSVRNRVLSDRVASTTPPSPATCIFAPDDHVVILGANWLIPGYADHLAALQQQLSLRITHLFNDVIPTAHPQWAAAGASPVVTPYLSTMLMLSTTIIVASQSTRHDIDDLVERGVVGRNQTGRVRTLAHGCDVLHGDATTAPPPSIDVARPFIVSVGTIEVRKNHVVLYQAYREAARRGIELPQLYIVGRSGWLAEATEHLISNDPVTNERIRIVRNVTDAEITWLYEHCLFTVYPSAFEGWGLPVAESLGCGKICLTTDHASLPEVGGEAADYLSPYDTNAWVEALDHYANNPGARTEQENNIRATFTSRTWDDATNDLVAILMENP